MAAPGIFTPLSMAIDDDKPPLRATMTPAASIDAKLTPASSNPSVGSSRSDSRSRSATPTSRLTPANDLSQQLAFKASKAVARALIELDLPGPLSKATALLRTLAEQDDRNAGEDGPSVFSGVESDEEEGHAYESFTGAPREPRDPSSASSRGPSSREHSARDHSSRSEEPQRYLPFINAVEQGGSDRDSPALPTCRASPLSSQRVLSSPAAASQINWAYINEEIRATVFKCYEQIQMVAGTLEETDLDALHEEGEEGEEGGLGEEGRDFDEADAPMGLGAATPGWLRQAITDTLAEPSPSSGGTPPPQPDFEAADDGRRCSVCSSSSGATLSSPDEDSEAEDSEAPPPAASKPSPASTSPAAGKFDTPMETPLAPHSSPERLRAHPPPRVPRTPEALLDRAATRWSLENAVLLRQGSLAERLSHALRTWYKHALQLDMWLLLSPAQLQSVAAGQQLTPMQLRQLASAARKASKSGGERGGGGRGRSSGHDGTAGGGQQGGGAAATRALKRRSMSERFQQLISAPSVSSEPAAPPAEPTAKWRDAPSVPGLPSMDRVWGVLSAMRPAASRRGSIKADAASAQPRSAQPQSAQPRRAARVAAPLSSADVPSAAEAGDKAAGAGQGAELGEEANDPTPLTPSVTSTRAKRPPPSNDATSPPPPPPKLVSQVALSPCSASCVLVTVSFVT